MTRPGESFRAEIADGDFERNRVAGEHLGLRRPGVEDGAVVAVCWSDIHEKQFGRGGQHCEIGVGPFLPLEIGEVINFRPRGGGRKQSRGGGAGQIDIRAAQPRFKLVQKSFGLGGVLRERHETGRQARLHEQDVHRVVWPERINQFAGLVNGAFTRRRAVAFVFHADRVVQHDQNLATVLVGGIGAEPFQHRLEKCQQQQQQKRRAQQQQNPMPPAMHLGPARHGFADQFDGRKLEMSRKSLVQQMQHQRQSEQRNQHGKQGWTQKGHGSSR